MTDGELLTLEGIGVENQVLCLIFAIVAGGIFAGIAGVHLPETFA